MPFNDLEQWRLFYLVEPNHLYNFCRGYQEEHFYEIILNLDQWFRRCLLKICFMWSSAGLFFSGHLCEVILYFNQWSRRRCRLKKFLIWSSSSPSVQ